MYSYKYTTSLSVIRDKKADLRQSKLVLHALAASYHKYIDSISVHRFKKPLEQLSLKQLDKLKKERVLVLEFWNYPVPQPHKMYES